MPIFRLSVTRRGEPGVSYIEIDAATPEAARATVEGQGSFVREVLPIAEWYRREAEQNASSLYRLRRVTLALHIAAWCIIILTFACGLILFIKREEESGLLLLVTSASSFVIFIALTSRIAQLEATIRVLLSDHHQRRDVA